MPTGHYDRHPISHEDAIYARLRKVGGMLSGSDLCTAMQHRLTPRTRVYALLEGMVAAGQLIQSRRNGGVVYSLPTPQEPRT